MLELELQKSFKNRDFPEWYKASTLDRELHTFRNEVEFF